MITKEDLIKEFSTNCIPFDVNRQCCPNKSCEFCAKEAIQEFIDAVKRGEIT